MCYTNYGDIMIKDIVDTLCLPFTKLFGFLIHGFLKLCILAYTILSFPFNH